MSIPSLVRRRPVFLNDRVCVCVIPTRNVCELKSSFAKWQTTAKIPGTTKDSLLPLSTEKRRNSKSNKREFRRISRPFAILTEAGLPIRNSSTHEGVVSPHQRWWGTRVRASKNSIGDMRNLPIHSVQISKDSIGLFFYSKKITLCTIGRDGRLGNSQFLTKVQRKPNLSLKNIGKNVVQLKLSEIDPMSL